MLSIIVFYFLILTGTRSVFYAVVISILLMYFLCIKNRVKTTTYLIPFIMMITLLGLTFFLISNFSPEFSLRLFELDNKIRVSIWLNGIKQLSFSELIFGRGLNRFSELSLAGNLVSSSGIGFSFHSLYLDIPTSSGILSLILLLIVFVSFFIDFLNKRNYLSFGLIVYIVISAITGIPVISLNFWVILGFLYISSKVHVSIRINERG